MHRLNGKIVAISVEDIFKRFLRLRNKYDYVLVDRPFKEILVDTENDKVAIRYQIRFHLKNGDNKNIYALTIFKIKNDQLVEFNEISSVMSDHL